MSIIIIISIIFIVIVYIYSYIQQKKRRNSNQRNLDTFRLQYHNRLNKNKPHNPANKNYVSKHNSQEDYREAPREAPPNTQTLDFNE